MEFLLEGARKEAEATATLAADSYWDDLMDTEFQVRSEPIRPDLTPMPPPQTPTPQELVRAQDLLLSEEGGMLVVVVGCIVAPATDFHGWGDH